MDWKATILLIMLAFGFFIIGLWVMFYSRKNRSKDLAVNNKEIRFSEVRKLNEKFLKK